MPRNIGIAVAWRTVNEARTNQTCAGCVAAHLPTSLCLYDLLLATATATAYGDPATDDRRRIYLIDTLLIVEVSVRRRSGEFVIGLSCETFMFRALVRPTGRLKLGLISTFFYSRSP